MKSFISFIVLFHFMFLMESNIYGQDLTLKDLINLQGNNLDDVNNFLSNRNWEFHSSNVEHAENLVNYTSVGWSLNKNEWEQKAQAWFNYYQHPNSESAVGYQTNKINFNRLKISAKDLGLKLVNTTALENSLMTRYRDNKIEVVFKTYKKGKDNEDDYSSDDDEVYYSIMVFNYKEVEDQKIFQEQLLQKSKELNLKYQNLISTGDSSFLLRNYNLAKKIFSEAKILKPEEEYPINKLAEINELLSFLEERKTKIYDYNEQNSSSYNDIYNGIVDDIKNQISNIKVTGTFKSSIELSIDTNGRTNSALTNSDISNNDVREIILNTAKKFKLKSIEKYNYSLNAKASFDIRIFLDDVTLKVQKNNSENIILNNTSHLYQSEVNNLLSSAPIGNYTILIQNKKINNYDFSNNKIIKYSGTGGPSNALLSTLVPGLGVHNVTGGSKSGLSTTLWSYGFILTGIGCKIYSLSEYDKYHNTTDQVAMNDYYSNANISNKIFYSFAAIGAFIWVYDICWVAKKGYENKESQKRFKKSLSITSNSNFSILGLSYKIKF